MTKEEKALAYDEALRKIRPLYERAKKEDCPIWSTYEYIFPELAENEDERIRRTLVEYFGRYNPENKWDDEFSFKDILAYLERQKEQKPTECDKETDTQKAFREGQNAGRQEVFDYPGAYGLERIDNVFGFRIGDTVRLKDGDGRPHIIKYFEKIEGLHGPDFYHVIFEDNTASDHIIPGDEFLNGYYTQMEKIDEQGEQKPAKWSEGG